MKMKMMRKLLGLAILLIVGDSQELEPCKGRKSYNRNDEPCLVRECRAITYGMKYDDADKCIRAPTCEELQDSSEKQIRKRSKKCRTLAQQKEKGRSWCLQARQGFPFVMTTSTRKNKNNGGNPFCEGNKFWYSFCVTAEATTESKVTIKEIRKTKLRKNEELFAVGSMKAGCAGKISGDPFRPYSRRCGLTYSVQYLQDAVNATEGQLIKKTIESGGIERSYWIFRSKNNTPQDDSAHPKLAPLVIDLHDRNSCAEILSMYSRWLEIAKDENMVVVWPQGAETFGKNQITDQLELDITSWAVEDVPFPATLNDIDDMSFLRKIIEELQGDDDMHIDPNRLYMAGHGNGADMAQQFTFKFPMKVAGVATHGGVLNFPFPLNDTSKLTEANLREYLGKDEIDNIEFDKNSPLQYVLTSKVRVFNVPLEGYPTVLSENTKLWMALNEIDYDNEAKYSSREPFLIRTWRNSRDIVQNLFYVNGYSGDKSIYEVVHFDESSQTNMTTTNFAWDFIKEWY